MSASRTLQCNALSYSLLASLFWHIVATFSLWFAATCMIVESQLGKIIVMFAYIDGERIAKLPILLASID